MKKQRRFIPFVLLPTLFVLVISCIGPASQKEQDGSTPVTAESPSTLTIIEELPHTVVAVEQEFTQVNNLSDLDITWTFGPCKIEFVGNPLQLNEFDIEIDDAGLTINPVENADTEDVFLLISSPTLTIIANYGRGTIQTDGRLDTESLEIGNMDGGAVRCDTVVCSRFNYQSRDASAAQFHWVKADEALVLADGTGTTELGLDVARLNLQAWGTQTITLTGRVGQKQISVTRTNMVNDLTE